LGLYFDSVITLPLDVFAFDLFDTDGDGALTEIEVKVMFHDLYWYKNTAKENEESRA
jgi:hypothetical protein